MIHIDKEKCIACGFCVKDCAAANIRIIDEKAGIINETCLLCGHCIAICPQNAVTLDEYPMEDVKEYTQQEFEIEPERMLNFIKFRRSVRQFKNTPIEEEKLLKVIEAGRFTATGSNRQDLSYIVVRDRLPQLRRLSLEKLAESSKQQAEKNPSLAGFAKRWSGMLESDKEVSGKNDRLFYNAPTVIMVVSESPTDAALAASNMELMAASLGLGVFYCGFFVRIAQGDSQVKELLGLNEKQEVRVCLVLGNPEVSYVRTVPRKPAVIDWI